MCYCSRDRYRPDYVSAFAAPSDFCPRFFFSKVEDPDQDRMTLESDVNLKEASALRFQTQSALRSPTI